MHKIEEASLVLARFVIVILVAIAVYQIFVQQWSHLFVVLQAIVLSMVPYFLYKKYGIYTPPSFRILIILFVFATLFLGEARSFYDTYWWWDALFHFVAGFGFALMGFIIMAVVYKKSDLKLAPILTLLFAFFFSMGLSALWEIYEFTVDSIFADSNMQPSLNDTMWDLISAFVGSLLASIISWRYLKYRKGYSYFENVIEDGVSENSDD